MNFKDIILGSTIPFAYRMAYLVNIYREPLLKKVEEDLGLKRPEWTVLLCLSMHNGMIAKDISTLTGQPRNSISRAIISLENQGLLRRHPNEEDKRRILLQITKKGIKKFTQIVPSFEMREKQMVLSLTDKEQDQLYGLLDKLCDSVPNWSKFDGAGR